MHEYEPAAPRPLEEVTEEIRLQLVWEESRRLAEADGAKALEALRAGSDWVQALEGLPGESSTELWVTRDSAELPGVVTSRVFILNRPVEGRPEFSGLSLRTGDYVVVALHATEPGEVNPGRMNEARQQLANLYGGLEFEALYQALEAQADILIFRDNL
jgi:peptidyl-prolyl cis-trans isomerase D